VCRLRWDAATAFGAQPGGHPAGGRRSGRRAAATGDPHLQIQATPAQVGLSQAERRANLTGAFHWTALEPPGDRLGLVDDVCTTGATLTAAAEAVAEAGGSIGAFLVLAVAQTLPVVAVT